MQGYHNTGGGSLGKKVKSQGLPSLGLVGRVRDRPARSPSNQNESLSNEIEISLQQDAEFHNAYHWTSSKSVTMTFMPCHLTIQFLS